MRAIKEARKYIERHPDHTDAKTLSQLVLALESEGTFGITGLYDLGYERFRLALQILEEWRLDRHYASKARLLDLSLQMAKHAPAGGKDDKKKPAADQAPVKEEKKPKKRTTRATRATRRPSARTPNRLRRRGAVGACPAHRLQKTSRPGSRASRRRSSPTRSTDCHCSACVSVSCSKGPIAAMPAPSPISRGAR